MNDSEYNTENGNLLSENLKPKKKDKAYYKRWYSEHRPSISKKVVHQVCCLVRFFPTSNRLIHGLFLLFLSLTFITLLNLQPLAFYHTGVLYLYGSLFVTSLAYNTYLVSSKQFRFRAYNSVFIRYISLIIFALYFVAIQKGLSVNLIYWLEVILIFCAGGLAILDGALVSSFGKNEVSSRLSSLSFLLLALMFGLFSAFPIIRSIYNFMQHSE